MVYQSIHSTSGAAGLVARAADEDNAYIFVVDVGNGGRAFLAKRVNGNPLGGTPFYSQVIADTGSDFGIVKQTWYHLKMEASGNNIRCFVDGSLLFDVTDDDLISGKYGFYGAGSDSRFDNVNVFTVDNSAVNPSGIDGDWQVTRSGSQSPSYWTLVQNGDDVEAYQKCDPNDPAVAASGSVSDSTVNLSYTLYDLYQIDFSGTLSGDSMSGTYMDSYANSGTWEAVRVPSYQCPIHQVQSASIVLDGSTSDWAGIEAAIVDDTGDADAISGSDIEKIYISKDSQNLYLRIDLANGSPASNLFYGISFYPHLNPQAGDRFIFINVLSGQCSVDERNAPGSGSHNFVAAGQMAVGAGVIECAVPLAALNPPSPSFVTVWDDQSGPSIDGTETVSVQFPQYMSADKLQTLQQQCSNVEFPPCILVHPSPQCDSACAVALAQRISTELGVTSSKVPDDYQREPAGCVGYREDIYATAPIAQVLSDYLGNPYEVYKNGYQCNASGFPYIVYAASQ